MQHSQLGFGVTGHLPMDTVRAIARRAGEIGLASLWFNETADGDALACAELYLAQVTELRDRGARTLRDLRTA